METSTKNDGQDSETFSLDNTASTSGMDQQFISPQNNPDIFQMTKNPKGRCIIISNRFSGTKEEREGTEVDEASLLKTFQYLQGENAEIKIENFTDLSAGEIKNKLTLFADFSEIPSFYAIVIMSHGRRYNQLKKGVNDMIEGTDKNMVSVKDVMGIFKNTVFKDVPILMFFEICRGDQIGAAEFKIVEAVDSFSLDNDNEDDVETLSDDDNSNFQFKWLKMSASTKGAESAPHSKKDAGACSYSGKDEIDDSARINVQENKNMMISFSTTKGYVSVRDEKTGSWFIQALCDELMKNASNTDLVAIMDQVHHVVHRKRADTEGFENCIIACDTAHTFGKKKLYFFPGLPK